jgi:fibronectin type 3 domain-containing protein
MKKIIIILLILLFSVTASAKDFKATLTWTANSEPDLKEYRIYRSETASKGYVKIGQTTTTKYEDNFTVPDNKAKTYYYVVTAVDDSGLESDYSNEVNGLFDANLKPDSIKNLQIIVTTVINVTAAGGIAVEVK